jgi:hypothetical protein
MPSPDSAQVPEGVGVSASASGRDTADQFSRPKESSVLLLGSSLHICKLRGWMKNPVSAKSDDLSKPAILGP